MLFFSFFLATPTTEIYTLSLHDALPILRDELLTFAGNLHGGVLSAFCDHVLGTVCYPVIAKGAWAATTEFKRSEEHTSELQSRFDLVCRLLLEKKKKN